MRSLSAPQKRAGHRLVLPQRRSPTMVSPKATPS
jgi:hypothetical protein